MGSHLSRSEHARAILFSMKSLNNSVLREPGMPLLVIMTVLSFSGFAALLPVAPMWAIEGGADAGGAGLVNGILMLFTVLTQLLVPSALRRFGWEPVLVTGMILLGLPTAGFFLSNSLGSILFFSALRGLGFGVITVTGSALVAELVDPMRRGQAIGIYGLAIAGPQIIFISGGPWLAETVGFGLIFAVGLLPLLGVVPAYLLGKKAERVPKAEGKPPYGQLFRPVVLLLAVTLAGGALISFMAQMTSSAGLSTIALLVLTVTTAVSRWRFGGLADTYGASRFTWPLVVTTVVGMSLLGWAVSDPDSTIVAPLLIGAALVGISYGGLQNLTLVLAFQAVKREHYGSASASWNVGFDAGTGLGSVLIGAIATAFSFSTAVLLVGAVSLLTVPVALRGRHS